MTIYHKERLVTRTRYKGDEIGSKKDGLIFKWNWHSDKPGGQITTCEVIFDVKGFNTGIILEAIQWGGESNPPRYEAVINTLGGNSLWSGHNLYFPTRILAQLEAEAALKEIGQAILEVLK